MKEHYRSPSYRPDLVAHRYVRRIHGETFRVFECVAKRKAKNRDTHLTKFGSGPTIREYDVLSDALPAWLLERMGVSRATWAWPL